MPLTRPWRVRVLSRVHPCRVLREADRREAVCFAFTPQQSPGGSERRRLTATLFVLDQTLGRPFLSLEFIPPLRARNHAIVKVVLPTDLIVGTLDTSSASSLKSTFFFFCHRASSRRAASKVSEGKAQHCASEKLF